MLFQVYFCFFFLFLSIFIKYEKWFLLSNIRIDSMYSEREKREKYPQKMMYTKFLIFEISESIYQI